MTDSKPQLFHSLTYSDAHRARDFLTAVGLVEVLVVPDREDPSRVQHAQFRWRDNGGVMFGSVRDGSPHTGADRCGQGSCYLVVPTDEEVDVVVDRALAAGGSPVQAPQAQDYGGRGATVADPEGNLWSIGSYPGE